MGKRRSRSSKSARRRAKKHADDRGRIDSMGNAPVRGASEGSATGGKPTETKRRPKVEIPEPHPGYDPQAALNAVAEYRAELKAWKQLPFWKRLLTPKPQHPVGS